MRNKITLKKIAQELNVSISTVSKSLKDSHEIGKETRERIKTLPSLMVIVQIVLLWFEEPKN